MPKTVVVIFICLLFNHASAQDKPGSWAGGGDYVEGQVITTVMKKMGADKKIILQINKAGGVSGTLSVTYDKAKASLANESTDQLFTVAGNYDAARSLLFLTLTHIKSANSAVAGLAFKRPDSVYYSVSLEKKEETMIMTGMVNALMNRNTTTEWIGSSQGVGLGMNVADNIDMHLLPLRIKLENAVMPEQMKDDRGQMTDDRGNKDTVIRQLSPVNLPLRKIEIQHTIVLDTSLIKLDLYDNGTIDGDIATLILDGKTIMASQLLSAKAASIILNLSKEKTEHILEMFADNLGSIPPNTALLVLTCRNKRYEINLSSNGTANGSVKLVFKSN